jgi:hypothetical protein
VQILSTARNARRGDGTYQARYVKIVAESEMNGNVWASAAEVEVLVTE